MRGFCGFILRHRLLVLAIFLRLIISVIKTKKKKKNAYKTEVDTEILMLFTAKAYRLKL